MIETFIKQLQIEPRALYVYWRRDRISLTHLTIDYGQTALCGAAIDHTGEVTLRRRMRAICRRCADKNLTRVAIDKS